MPEDATGRLNILKQELADRLQLWTGDDVRQRALRWYLQTGMSMGLRLQELALALDEAADQEHCLQQDEATLYGDKPVPVLWRDDIVSLNGADLPVVDLIWNQAQGSWHYYVLAADGSRQRLPSEALPP